MPVIPVESTPPEEDARTIAGGKGFQAWLLDLLEWSLDVPPPAPPDGHAIANGTPTDAAPEPAIRLEGGVPGAGAAHHHPLQGAEPEAPQLQKQLARRLRRWHGKVADQGLQFASLDIPARHELRKRGKRLRYSPGLRRIAAARRQAARLPQAAVARAGHPGRDQRPGRGQEHYEACTATHPQAWFALGWISARLEELATEAQQAFDDLAHSKPFWK